MVLTGNASEIQAAINQATVKGAMGATATQQVEGDDRGFWSDVQEYYQMRQNYLDHLDTLQAQGKINRLVDMQAKIEDIVNRYNLGGPNYYQGWGTVPRELFEDYNNWNNEVKEIKASPEYQHSSTQSDDAMVTLFQTLDEDHRALDSEFVYNMMEPGIGRVNYFRNKIQEYQNVIANMNSVAQYYFGGGHFGQVSLQEFTQRLMEFQQRLTEAQQFYELAKNDLPSAGDESNKITAQNQIAE